ncbi:putative ribonuclease H-like domain-containing protein [Tanacetum coccineum]
MKEAPTSYANKFSPTSLTKANLRKFEANVPNDADFDIWLPLASVHEVNDRMKSSRYGYFIGKRLAFHVVECLLIEELSCVPVWVKFHNALLVAYTSDGLSLIATKIGTPMMLDSHTNSMCLESWGRSSYARILIDIYACNGFCDNLVMVVPNLDEPRYTKKTIRVEYEWEPLCCSTCLIFGHLVDDCPKVAKRVVKRVDKCKGGSSGADDEGFVEVKKKKSSGNNESTKNFKPVSMKPKTQYLPKVNESTEGNNGKKNVPTSGNSSKKTSMMNASTSEDEVELVDNEMTNFLASKPLAVGHGTKSLLEQYRETYGNVEYDYEPYDDDLYERQEIPDHIQSICNNLDIKV